MTDDAIDKALQRCWSTGSAFDGQGGRISAAALRDLIVSSDPPPGSRKLANLEVEGRLDLSCIAASLAVPLPALHFDGCTFDAPIDLGKSRIVELRLTRCRLPGLSASNARIDGDLDLAGSSLGSGNAASLRGEGLAIGGRLALHSAGPDRFLAQGEIRLLGARIGGNFEAPGALLSGEGRACLSMDGAEIAGGLFLSSTREHRFEARGSLRLLGLRVMQDVTLRGASLNGAGEYGLSLERATIAGKLFLVGSTHQPLQSEGGLRLADLSAGNVVVDGVAIEPDGRGMTLDLSGAAIRGDLVLGRVTSLDHGRPAGRYDLSGASVGGLEDDLDASWPTKGNLALDGFTYGALSGVHADADNRLAWLDLQYLAPPAPDKFRPQPFEQLAAVLRSQGHAWAADQVAMCKRDWAIECGTERGLNRFLERFMQVVAGHGYQRRRAIGWTAAWWLLGMLWIAGSTAAGAIQFADPDGTPFAAPGPLALPARETGFLLPVYALELMVPFIDFGQTGSVRMIARTPAGDMLLVWRAVYQVIGALLVTVLGVTLTGLLRKD